MTQRFSLLDSPIGELLLTGDSVSVTGIWMQSHRSEWQRTKTWQRDDRAFAATRVQLTEYFAGERSSFELPLAPEGTAFQRSVWRQLQEIPYGETISYDALARRIAKLTDKSKQSVQTLLRCDFVWIEVTFNLLIPEEMEHDTGTTDGEAKHGTA